jgi:DNA-binding response OmpR family regulator
LLRRAAPRENGAFLVGDASVDLRAFTVTRRRLVHTLSPTEAAMLELLWLERGRAVSRERFLREVWHGGLHVGNRTIDTHVLHLRKKLGTGRLLTVHGVGYKLVP